MSNRLEDAMYGLERLGNNTGMSEPQKERAIRAQYDCVIHILADEVRKLMDTVNDHENLIEELRSQGHHRVGRP